MYVTPFRVAHRFLGQVEVPGPESNPWIRAALELDGEAPEGDETPWCSAFVNLVCWLLGLPRTHSWMARSWLRIGVPVDLEEARADSDVVVLWRGSGELESAQRGTGHVGFFAGLDVRDVWLLGGNQGDAVTVASFPRARVLGVRRLDW